MKIIFAGTPEFSVSFLRALLEAGHEIVAVYTQPDRPAGRGRKLLPSAVKLEALAHHLPVFQPETLKSETAQQQIIQHTADLMIVVAYGLLLPEKILRAIPLGGINVHASLLPRYRGAAPIQRALLAGETETGITLMQMDAGLDTGDMLAKYVVPIQEKETTGTLQVRLAQAGAQLLIQFLQTPPASWCAEKQDALLATYAHKIARADAEIDWEKPAVVIERMIRAYHPIPHAFTFIEGERLKILQARVSTETFSSTFFPGKIIRADKTGLYIATGKGVLVAEIIQLPSGKALFVREILNARKEKFSSGWLG